MGMLQNRLGICAAVAVCLGVTGCGGIDHGKSGPVSGTVTADGKPLGNISVYFQPESKGTQSKEMDTGMGSYAITDVEGKFELKFSDDDSPGAIVGTHVVTLTDLDLEGDEEDDAGGGRRIGRIPPKFAGETHTFEVPAEGTTEANFDVGVAKGRN